MIKCIVVEDERIALSELEALLAGSQAEVVGAYQNPLVALDEIAQTQPDAAFVDIEMPGMSGIEFANKLTQALPIIQIVFVTAYKQYAIKAFDVGAVHYLLKPVTQQHVDEAIARVQRHQQMSVALGEVNEPTLVKSKTGVIDRISVRDKDDIVVIKIEDILYLQSGSGVTTVVTKKGSYNTRTGLRLWESQLGKLGFLRCHKSYIVNAEYITKMIHILGEYKELCLGFSDVNIPISRRKVGVVKAWLGVP